MATPSIKANAAETGTDPNSLGLIEIKDQLFGEEFLIQTYHCSLLKAFPKGKILVESKLYLTNYRIILCIKDSAPTHYFLEDINDVSVKKVDNKELFLFRLNQSEIWRMKSEKEMLDLDLKVKKWKKIIDEKGIMKCRILLEDEELRKLYKTLVIEKKSMSDDEFWEDREMIKYFDRFSQAAKQSLGKSTKPMFRSNTSYKKETNAIPELNATAVKELHDLLRREKRLFEIYKKQVYLKKRKKIILFLNISLSLLRKTFSTNFFKQF